MEIGNGERCGSSSRDVGRRDEGQEEEEESERKPPPTEGRVCFLLSFFLFLVVV